MTILIPVGRGHVTVVDDEDEHLARSRRWHALLARNRIYARGPSGKRNQRVYLHRLIVAAPPGLEVDHINGDTLDNRRANLRVATRQQNAANGKGWTGRRYSRFKGVTWRASRLKWIAGITVHYERHWLGEFDSEEEAAKAYDRAAVVAFGEFANLNFSP